MEDRLENFTKQFLEEESSEGIKISNLMKAEEKHRMKLLTIDWKSMHFLYARAPKSKQLRKVIKKYRKLALSQFMEAGINIRKSQCFITGIMLRESGGFVVVTTLVTAQGKEHQSQVLLNA